MTSEEARETVSGSGKFHSASSQSVPCSHDSLCSADAVCETLTLPPEVLEQQNWSKPFKVPKLAKKRKRKEPLDFNPSVKCVHADPEQMLEILKLRPQLGNEVSEATIAATLPPDLLKMAAILYNKTLPIMIDKPSQALLCSGIVRCVPLNFEEFQKTYAKRMNESAKLLLQQKFSSLKRARLVFNQMIRSYLPNMCAVSDGVKKRKSGFRTTFSCISVGTKKRRYAKEKEKSSEVTPCKWRAVLWWDSKTNTCSFTEISPFEVHCEDCLKCDRQFSSDEVDFQSVYPRLARFKAMSLLHQLPVMESTLSMRRVRGQKKLREYDRSAIMKQFDPEFNDQSVTNLSIDEIKTRGISDTSMQLLQLLSFIRKEDGANVKAFFLPDKKGDTALSVIAFMWKPGQCLLASHHDTIYCDSIWGSDDQGSKIATIVVVNCDNHIQLAAAAIMMNETAEAWGCFFKWVKECVPEFSPECVVTDGAECVFNEFYKVVRPRKVTHITCWWHKRNTLTKNYGGGTFTKALTGVTYCDNFEQVQKKLAQLSEWIEKSRPSVGEKATERKYEELAKQFEQAFVNLQVFTGGTVTNSYAESINKCLRDLGLTTDGDIFDCILRLRGYCKYPPVVETTLTAANKEELLKFLQADVVNMISNGVVKQQLALSKRASEKCEIVCESNDKFAVTEQVIIPINKGWAITRKAIATVTWIEDRNYFHCSCNRLVYQGMPCMHILHVAQEHNKKVPLECFNKRFFCPQYLEQLEQPQGMSQQGGAAEDIPETTTTSSSQEDPAAAATPPQPQRTSPQRTSQQEATEVSQGGSTPPPMDLDSAYHNIPGGCPNIILSNIFAHHGDDESMDLLARFLTLQVYVFEGLKPLVDKDTLLQLINGWGKQTMEMIKKRSAGRSSEFGITPRATKRNRRDSWKTVPQKVNAQALRLIMQSDPFAPDT